MPTHEKCNDDIRVHLGETLKRELKVLAAQDRYDSLSPFIRKVLHEYVYGHSSAANRLLAGTVRDE